MRLSKKKLPKPTLNTTMIASKEDLSREVFKRVHVVQYEFADDANISAGRRSQADAQAEPRENGGARKKGRRAVAKPR